MLLVSSRLMLRVHQLILALTSFIKLHYKLRMIFVSQIHVGRTDSVYASIEIMNANVIQDLSEITAQLVGG